MNEIKIKVKFKKGLCYSQGIKLVQNDYNSTKLVFEFDDNEGTKIFELRDSDDNVILADEIVNNELILARFDEHDNAYPIFTKEGEYVYEISLYKDNSKLTSASDKFKVNAEQVIIDGEIVETYTPMFDNLLSDLSSALQETDNLDIDVSKSGNVATVTITKKDGTEESVEISDGRNGQSGRDGRDGADATINGVSALTVEAGENITLEQEGSTLIINSESGTLDYPELTNKPSINNVTLNGNKTSSDLGLQPVGNYLTEETDPTVPSHVKNITQANITSWNNKSDFSGNYNDLTNKPSINNVTLSGNKSLNDLGIQPAGNYITNTVNDLVNYYTKTETFTKQEINNLISAITTMDIQVVQTLPVQDISATTIYLVPKTTTETNDAYDEYIYVSNAWEHIGSTEVDLTDYVKNTDYATAEKGGTIRISNASGLGISNGNLYAVTKAYNTYNSASGNMFIGKGTLENVIAGKGLVTNQDISGKANKISVVQTSASTIEINPNTFYKFGEVASLNITLASITDNTIYNEYMFEFVSGTTATTLTLPSSIKWLETPTIDANKIYQCSIVDNVGLLVGVANV